MVLPFFGIALNDHHLLAEFVLPHDLLFCMFHYTILPQLSTVLPILVITYYGNLDYHHIILGLQRQTPLFIAQGSHASSFVVSFLWQLLRFLLSLVLDGLVQ